MKLSFSILLTLIVLTLLSCSYTQKIKDGKTAYERKQFSVAIPMLKKEYKKAKTKLDKSQFAYLLGESYRQVNDPASAAIWYQTAYDNGFGLDALKNYAFALKQNEQYSEAIQAFKNLGIELGTPYEYRKEITACKQAKTWKKGAKRSPFIVKQTDINSSASEYSPTLFGENQLVFTSDRAAGTGDEIYNWTGKDFSDLFIADLSVGTVMPFDLNINSTDNEGAASFTEDFSEIYFTRCFSEGRQDAYCKIMVSRSQGDSWSAPQVLNFVKENVNYGHPSISPDGNTLYFSCNDPEGWGGYDIYFSERTAEGWGEPRLMGRSVNTPRDEKFPNINKDTLYFSSSGHVGMGGLDIFRSYKLGNGTWSPPQNLKPPINSASDDFGLIIDNRQLKEEDVLLQGYFSSSRPNGSGKDDIYSFEKRILPPEEIVDTIEQKPLEYKMVLDGYVLEKIYSIKDDPNSEILGRKPLNGATVDINFNNKKQKVTVGEDGFFSITLEENTDYEFFVSADRFLANTNRFSTKGIGRDPSNPELRFEIEIVLDRIFLDKEIRLENIYYDFDEAYIREDAMPTLNELADILNQNPTIIIELGSHTDCRGNARYNEDLSRRRAQSAVDYLISKGIKEERLFAKGYGEDSPAVDCNCAACSEEEHQENRRTTFKIVEE